LDVVFETCERTDRHTDTLIAILRTPLWDVSIYCGNFLNDANYDDFNFATVENKHHGYGMSA